MKHNWEKCLAHTKISEGGYVNDPIDPGGETNHGISKRAYPHLNIKSLTWKQAAAIYKRDYWDAVSGDKLPDGLDLVAFDAAVNSGVSRGAKWLQMALGVNPDGRIGPVTIKAAIDCNKDAVIRDACEYRLAFMRGLKTWYRYKNGWTRRVEGVRDTATDMARGSVSEPVGGGLWASLLRLIMGVFKK